MNGPIRDWDNEANENVNLRVNPGRVPLYTSPSSPQNHHLLRVEIWTCSECIAHISIRENHAGAYSPRG